MKKVLIFLVLSVMLVGCSISNRSVTNQKGKINVSNENDEIKFLGPIQAQRTAETSKYLNQVVEDELYRERELARQDERLKQIRSGVGETTDETGFEFVIKNNSQNDDKFVVITELHRIHPKSWSFRVPIGKLVTRPVEVGLYQIKIFRDGYQYPVRIDSFEVLSEKIKELDGSMYNGGCIITGQ